MRTGRPVWSGRADKGRVMMGEHAKPAPDPGQGTPPPGNADGKVERPQPGSGTHKK